MKIRDKEFPAQETVGIEEEMAVSGVMKTGLLSHFRGNATDRFYGGPKVQEFEGLFSKYLTGEKDQGHTISVNSCTSALHICCGAIGLKPGDEVIVTPWSMSCSASAPLLYGATPVFADVDSDTFCLSYDSVRSRITYKTKAIIIPSIFGLSFDPRISTLCDNHNIFIIEDAAQALGSSYVGEDGDTYKTGTLGDLSCFSFTQGKHLTCGEGGAIFTKSRNMATRCRLLRNHSEAVLFDYKRGNASDRVVNDLFSTPTDNEFCHLPGFNMRMTEVGAAIMVEQLRKLDRFVKRRQHNAKCLDEIFGKYPDIFELPMIPDGWSHSFYVYALKVKVPFQRFRKDIVSHLNSRLPGESGRPDKHMFSEGYIEPLYNYPVFNRTTDGYSTSTLPTVEYLQRKSVMLTTIIGLPLTEEDFSIIDLAVASAVTSLGGDDNE